MSNPWNFEPPDVKNGFLAQQLYESAMGRSPFVDLGFPERPPRRLTRRQRLAFWWADNVAWRFARRPPWEDE